MIPDVARPSHIARNRLIRGLSPNSPLLLGPALAFLLVLIVACDGDRGVPGDQGPPGDTGPPGEPGAIGPAGFAGPAGTAGDAGEQGPAGQRGSLGPTGKAGDSGPTGDTGPTGLPGSEGPPGPAGSQGLQGQTGLTGSTGPTGSPGPAGTTGPPGTPGPVGPEGPTGPQGPTGPERDGLPTFVVKTADESVTGSNTLQPDDELFFIADPDSTYFFLANLLSSGNSAFLWGFASTTAVTGGFSLTGNLNPDPKPFGDIFTSGSGARTILTFGTLTTGPAGTTISLEWAQTIDNPSTTATIGAGSFIQYTKIR